MPMPMPTSTTAAPPSTFVSPPHTPVFLGVSPPHTPPVSRPSNEPQEVVQGQRSEADSWMRIAQMIAKRDSTEHDIALLADLLAFCDEHDWTIDDVRGTLTRAL
jgi:hypothetical protein